MEPEMLETPNPPVLEQSYVLRKNVAAIEILSSDSQPLSRLGPMTQLPAGSRIDVGRPGFNDQHDQGPLRRRFLLRISRRS